MDVQSILTSFRKEGIVFAGILLVGFIIIGGFVAWLMHWILGEGSTSFIERLGGFAGIYFISLIMYLGFIYIIFKLRSNSLEKTVMYENEMKCCSKKSQHQKPEEIDLDLYKKEVMDFIEEYKILLKCQLRNIESAMMLFSLCGMKCGCLPSYYPFVPLDNIHKGMEKIYSELFSLYEIHILSLRSHFPSGMNLKEEEKFNSFIKEEWEKAKEEIIRDMKRSDNSSPTAS